MEIIVKKFFITCPGNHYRFSCHARKPCCFNTLLVSTLPSEASPDERGYDTYILSCETQLTDNTVLQSKGRLSGSPDGHLVSLEPGKGRMCLHRSMGKIRIMVFMLKDLVTFQAAGFNVAGSSGNSYPVLSFIDIVVESLVTDIHLIE